MSENLTYHYGHDCFDGGEGEVEAGERFCIIDEGFNGGKMSYNDSLEAKALAASRNHSEAERRRRERINTHLSTLRRLIPSRDKMDKATLLGEVIHHVKELKKRFAEAAKGDSIPTDFDDLKVESNGGDEKGRNFMRVSICCDDRPDPLADLLQSFNEQRLKTVKAEMSCLGSRVRNVFLVTVQEEVNGSNEKTVCFNSVGEALREILKEVRFK
ncbi:hypothetical protein SUGI_0298370 [Cryptomeria japonica]|nr:hypothetical protein SUGI_0298370 [Cryptomeria japonica]